MVRYSFIIPCYGSELTIEKVVSEIQNTIKSEDSYEIILINDCSPDHVFNRIKTLCGRFPNIIGLNLAKNTGKHNALMAGLRCAQGVYICHLDDDGQCPFDKFYGLVQPLFYGNHVSYARYGLKKQTGFKNFGSWLNNIMASVLIGKPPKLQLTNFVVMQKFVRDEIIKYTAPYTYIDGLILRTARKVINVPMEDRTRFAGETTFTLAKMLQLWMNGFTSFSIIPLRVTTFLGFLIALVGLAVMIIIVAKKILYPYIVTEGWSSLIGTVLLMGGLNLFMLGMLGEYVGRIFLTLSSTPQYVVEEKLNGIQ